jgi:hypothetical protein
MQATQAATRLLVLIAMPIAMLLAVGCQSNSISARRLRDSQLELRHDGLSATRMLPTVCATGATPAEWVRKPTEFASIYTHEQWVSPSKTTGVGVVYVRVPFPVGPTAILWLAEQHFEAMPGQKGRIAGEWIDPLGRRWFTARNADTYVCGYIMTEGNAAWIVYFGHKLDAGFHPDEMSVAARAVTTIVPLTRANERETDAKVVELP